MVILQDLTFFHNDNRMVTDYVVILQNKFEIPNECWEECKQTGYITFFPSKIYTHYIHS